MPYLQHAAHLVISMIWRTQLSSSCGTVNRDVYAAHLVIFMPWRTHEISSCGLFNCDIQAVSLDALAYPLIFKLWLI